MAKPINRLAKLPTLAFRHAGCSACPDWPKISDDAADNSFAFTLSLRHKDYLPDADAHRPRWHAADCGWAEAMKI